MAELRSPTADRWDFDKGFRVNNLGACFTRGISFGDVDAETESNGYYLVIEGKRDGERLSRGQLYTMRSRVKDGRTCLIVYGEPPYDVHFMQQFMWGVDDGIVPADIDDLHSFCTEWQEWADSQPRPLKRNCTFRGTFTTRMVVSR